MGTVHARSLEPLPASGPDFGGLGEEAEFVEVEPEAKQEILENKDVVVQHVHFDGLGRTKDDIIICEIGEVFKAKNLIEVMRKSHEARERLLRLGIFRQVDVLIDTCQGDDALPNGLDVTFEVTELRRLTGSYNTMVGNNEGSMVLGLKLPNLLGRAEKVTFQFSYGTKETSYGLSFFKPQPGNFERNFSVNLYKVTGQFPWSSLRETDRGVSAEYSVSPSASPGFPEDGVGRRAVGEHGPLSPQAACWVLVLYPEGGCCPCCSEASAPHFPWRCLSVLLRVCSEAQFW